MPVELTIVETVTELETTVTEVILESASTPGPAGPGVPTGGSTGHVLAKASDDDLDTEWVPAGGGAGTDDQTAAEVPFTPAGNIAATDVQAAIQELDSEKAASSHAHAGEDITSGTVADARIAATIARDSEVTSAISTSEAGQVRDGDAAGGVLSGTYPNPGFAADMATQAELDAHLNDAADAHDASAISFTPAGTIAATDVQAAIEEVASEAGGASGEALQRDITQAGHGLAVGDVVMFNGTSWAKAQADSAANAEAVGIVSAVDGTDDFTLHYGGRITGLSGLTAGEVYYLDDDTAGLLTTTEPADVGDISKPLLIADSTTSGLFFNFRGAEVAAETGSVLIATSIGALPDAPVDGQAAMLRLGGSHFVPLIYDATYDKWVSEEQFGFAASATSPTATTTSTSAANLTNAELQRGMIPHTKECYDAGLRLQVWFIVGIWNSSGANTTFAQVRVREIASGEGAAADIWQSAEVSTSSTTTVWIIHDWADVTHTSAPSDTNGGSFFELWGRVTAGTGSFFLTAAKYRWAADPA